MMKMPKLSIGRCRQQGNLSEGDVVVFTSTSTGRQMSNDLLLRQLAACRRMFAVSILSICHLKHLVQADHLKAAVSPNLGAFRTIMHWQHAR